MSVIDLKAIKFIMKKIPYKKHHSKCNFHDTYKECTDDKKLIEPEKTEEALFYKLKQFSDENGGKGINWMNPNQEKWTIVFDIRMGEPCVGYDVCFKNFGQVYFISREITKQAIELFYNELIDYFTYKL